MNDEKIITNVALDNEEINFILTTISGIPEPRAKSIVDIMQKLQRALGHSQPIYYVNEYVHYPDGSVNCLQWTPYAELQAAMDHVTYALDNFWDPSIYQGDIYEADWESSHEDPYLRRISLIEQEGTPRPDRARYEVAIEMFPGMSTTVRRDI